MPKPSLYIQWKNSSTPGFPDRIYSDAPQTLNTYKLPTPSLGALPETVTVTQTWEKKLDGGVFGEITLSGNSLFIGTKNGSVYEIDRHSGATLRQFYIGTFVSPTPIIWKRRLFVGEGLHTTHHARIYAFDLDSGKLINSFTTSGHTEGVPVIATHNRKSLIFVSAGKDGLYALDPMTLEPLWHQKIGHVDSEVRVVNGMVLFSTGLEKDDPKGRPAAMALEFNTGQIVWKRDLAASGWRAPVIFSDRVCFSLGEVFFPSDFGQVACFDSSTGAPLTAINFEQPLIGIPRGLNQLILTSDIRGTLCLSDPAKAQRRWCHSTLTKGSTEHKVYASPSLSDRGLILYPHAKAGIIGLRPENGEQVFHWLPQDSDSPWNQVLSSVRSDGQNYYVADWDGLLRKLHALHE
jgi:outer membrane protein assembly factor BamB